MIDYFNEGLSFFPLFFPYFAKIFGSSIQAPS